MAEYKEIKRINIAIDVCLPAEGEGHLANEKLLAEAACRTLNKQQQRFKERGYCYLHYKPIEPLK